MLFDTIIPKKGRTEDEQINIDNFCRLESLRFFVIKERENDIIRTLKLWFPVDKEVYCKSEQLHLKGVIDRVDLLWNGSKIPFEYKTGNTPALLSGETKRQLVLYSLLLEEKYNTPVTHMAVMYSRSGKVFFEEIHPNSVRAAKRTLENTIEKIEQNIFPPRPGFMCHSHVSRRGKFIEGCAAYDKCRAEGDIDFDKILRRTKYFARKY